MTDRPLFSSETTNAMWKSWLNYLEHKRIKEATIQVFFYHRGSKGDEGIRSWKQFDAFPNVILAVQDALIANQDEIGMISITSGSDLEDVFLLANMEDMGYPGHKEHVQINGNKFENEEGMKPEEQERRRRLRDQRMKEEGRDPD